MRIIWIVCASEKNRDRYILDLFSRGEIHNSHKLSIEHNNREAELESIKVDLRANKNIVIHCNNFSRRVRKYIMGEILEYYNRNREIMPSELHTECIVLYENLSMLINDNTDHASSKEALTKIKTFEVPLVSDGFNKVRDGIVGEDTLRNAHNIKSDIENLLLFNQENKHHNCTLGWHTLLVFQNLLSKKDEIHYEKELLLAALLHDLGKPYTKEYNKEVKDLQVRETSEAHYYNHANVSAYLAELYLVTSNLTLEQFRIVQLFCEKHMNYDNKTTEKTRNKLDKMTEEEFNDTEGNFFKDLLLLVEADRNAKDNKPLEEITCREYIKLLKETKLLS